MSNNGDAIIVWSQDDSSSDKQIFVSKYESGGWTHPANIDDNISPDGQDTHWPHADMDKFGNFIIVWYQSDGTNFQSFLCEYR